MREDAAAGLGQVTVEMLRETFDAWTVAETGGRFLAYRTGYSNYSGPRSLIRGCVIAQTAEGLAEQLCLQAWLEALPAAELEAVWRGTPAAGGRGMSGRTGAAAGFIAGQIAAEFPAYTVTVHPGRGGAAFHAVRCEAAAGTLFAVVTGDEDELRGALAAGPAAT